MTLPEFTSLTRPRRSGALIMHLTIAYIITQ